MASTTRDLIKHADHLFKLLGGIVDTAKTNARGNPLKELDGIRKPAVEQLKLPRYYWKHAHWLIESFPDAELRDVPGLAKLVGLSELEVNDWSLTPGRYVGVAPQVDDEDFHFEETLRNIHIELQGLNEEAAELAAKIIRNFEVLEV